ncbi:MAG: hypothetical protein ISN29_12090 [Gammaproteobacteria bacterium AqS3]|nr:hypothetical protein [Gammaproteobacteria bacterium AqS3]
MPVASTQDKQRRGDSLTRQSELSSVFSEHRSGKMTYADPAMPWYLRIAVHATEICTGRPLLQMRYVRARPALRQASPGADVWDRAIDAMNIRGDSWPAEADLARLRRPGRGLLIVANHPFGVVDGVVLSWISSRIDEQFYVIATGVLCIEPNLNSHILPIDFSSRSDAAKRNLVSRQLALEKLRGGGVVSLFPAGSVGAPPRRGEKPVDYEWKAMTGRLINRSGCDVLPIHFRGCNSGLFQSLCPYPDLRQALYLRETRRLLDRECRFEVRPVIRSEDIPGDMKASQLALWLRERLSLDTPLDDA